MLLSHPRNLCSTAPVHTVCFGVLLFVQESADRLLEVVRSHVSGAQLVTAAGAEVSIRLPKEQSANFAGVSGRSNMAPSLSFSAAYMPCSPYEYIPHRPC